MSVSEETRDLALQLINYLVDGYVDIIDFHAVVEARVLSESRDWPVEVDELVEDVASHLIKEGKSFKSFASAVQLIIDIRRKALNVTGRGVKELVTKDDDA